MMATQLGSIDQLVELLGLMGRAPSAEAADFTELDHGLQCAYELSLRAPDDIALQLAGLVHDIGHQFGDDDAHGRLGGEAVRALLGDRVAALVTAHVPAKRYLVTVDDRYRESLSAVSQATLSAQGGRLDPAELAAFHRSPFRDDAVTLRIADDAAKVAGRPVPGLDHWLPALTMLAALASQIA